MKCEHCGGKVVDDYGERLYCLNCGRAVQLNPSFFESPLADSTVLNTGTAYRVLHQLNSGGIHLDEFE